MTVLKRRINNVGYISLNNPKKLNALDKTSIKMINSILDDFYEDDKIKVIIIESSNRKSFCSGGDVVSLYYDQTLRGKDPKDFFKDEFELDKKVLNSKKVIVSFINGITMGGGVGISINSDRVISDDTSLFAMPEAKLGIIPDVGVGYHFSKLEKPLALYLSLTGAIIEGSDLKRLKLCSNYIKNINSDEIKEKINKLNLENLGKEDILKELDNILNLYEEDLKATEFSRNVELIEKYFDKNSLEEILSTLRSDDNEFSNKILGELERSSLLSLEIIFYKYFKGKELSLEETYDLDLKILDFLNKIGNFKEGVRASMIDKDKNPKFNYNTFCKIKDINIGALLEL